MIEKNRTAGHPPLDSDVADKLLDLLSSDDNFRDRFQQDPADALASVGHADPTAAVAGASCLCVSTLAPKEEIQASRDLLRGYLTSAGTHTVVYSLEAGNISSSLRRR